VKRNNFKKGRKKCLATVKTNFKKKKENLLGAGSTGKIRKNDQKGRKKG